MTNRYMHGFIKLAVSQLIDAPRKSAALETAQNQCHERNMETSRLILLDEKGTQYRAYVNRIGGVKWYYAEPADICNRFSVKGKIGLNVYMEVDEDAFPPRKTKFSLMQRMLNDSPTIVFTAGAENVFLKVDDYDIEWDFELHASDPYLTAV